MEVRRVCEEDVERIVAAWNAALPYDRVSERQFRGVMLEDRNYEPEGALIATEADGSVLALSVCAVRRSVAGRDGGGREDEFKFGFLKGFFAAEGEGGEAAAGRLLAEAERYCREAGKQMLRVAMYTGPYIFPGIDIRYERLRETLARHGYRDVWTIEDVAVQFGDLDLARLLDEARRRVGEVELVEWRPELLEEMRRFVEEGAQSQWFPVGWEARYGEPDETTVVLRRGGEIVGWAHYWPGRPRCGFGPILVLPRARGNGYGSLLLRECMARAARGGGEYMSAGWANTPFYVVNGWHIVRRFAVLLKEL